MIPPVRHYRNMNNEDAVISLFALAHPARLNIFRLVAQAGPSGLPAGHIARTVGIPANTASTHLSILTGAGLLTAYRDGRSIIYSAVHEQVSELVRFLADDCCGGHPAVKQALNSAPAPQTGFVAAE